MSRPTVAPTGHERFLGENSLIVSKTDTKGIITYCNRTFLDIADYKLEEAMGQPHNLVRHPAMPRAAFKLVWDTIAAGQEIFAYVINLAKNGDHYWVYAHVTPSFDKEGRIVGYHSNRRAPRREAINVVEPLYRLMCQEEAKHASPKDGIAASTALLVSVLNDKGVDYDRLIHSI